MESPDNLYTFDESKLDRIRASKPWLNDPKFFRSVKISPSAIIKMMSHGQSGVEKGTLKGGKPIEVMGLLLGRPDTEDPSCIIICDAQPLPIEGFETRVIADDESVLNYMIDLGESNELTRKERFCGWYHTHPFDVDIYSQCFLSSTDVSTQLQWQRSEDPYGNPWVAIVIDPLRSFYKGKPQLSAFRVYPPEFTAPANETPDGRIVTDDQERVERWGAIWNRYYELPVHFYMSSLAQTTLSLLKNKFLWQSTLAENTMGSDNVLEFNTRISKASDVLKSNNISGTLSRIQPDRSSTDEFCHLANVARTASSECCQCCIQRSIKDLVFSRNKTQEK